MTRHVGNLSHGNRLISFSFGDSAWATRTPEDYTNQTESRWKEVTMSWTVSKWIFYGGGGFTNVLKYMWNAVLYEWQYFLDFEKKNCDISDYFLLFLPPLILMSIGLILCVLVCQNDYHTYVKQILKKRALKHQNFRIYSKTIFLWLIPSVLSFIVVIWALVRSLLSFLN